MLFGVALPADPESSDWCSQVKVLSTTKRWRPSPESAAVADVEDVMAALKIALELVDEGRLPYATANKFCRRLINQALCEKIIVERR